MEKIRQAIDTRLAGQHLPETVYDALCARPARRSRVRRAAALLAARRTVRSSRRRDWTRFPGLWACRSSGRRAPGKIRIRA